MKISLTEKRRAAGYVLSDAQSEPCEKCDFVARIVNRRGHVRYECRRERRWYQVAREGHCPYFVWLIPVRIGEAAE